MTQGTPYPARPGSALPLILAGAALVTAAYLVWDRVFPSTVYTDSAPRIVTPRGELAPYEKDINQIYESNRPAVVHITSPEVPIRTRYGYEWLAEGAGSGFIWDDRGYVVTNYHVVRGRRTVLVRLDNQKEYEADVIGWRDDLDIAVVRLKDPPPGLRTIVVGSSHDLIVGQTVLAIGNPFGLDQSLSTGVISALNRTIQSLIGTPIRGVIQVDAAINPGNSGGPLLDSASRLIGMNTAIKSPSGASAGVGFAVPVDTINRVVPELMQGRAQQPDLALGVRVTYLPRRDGYLVMVSQTQEGSGAQAAGLRGETRSRQDGRWYAGDVLISIDGQPIDQIEDIAAALRGHAVGDVVDVVVVRGLPYRQEKVVAQVELRSPESFR